MSKKPENAVEALELLESKTNIEYYVGKEAADLIRKKCNAKPAAKAAPKTEK